MTRYIDVQVDEEYMTKRGSVIGAEESHDDVFLRILFGPSWDGLIKSAIWQNALGAKVAYGITSDMLVDGQYIVPIPIEVKKYAGKATLSIRGVTLEDGEGVVDVAETSATLTASTYFMVLPSTYSGNEQEPVPVAADDLDRLMRMYELLYPTILTQDEYDALVEEGKVVEGHWYLIPDEE